MTEMDNRIAKMPAKMAFAVLDLRKVHACIMELPRSTNTGNAQKRCVNMIFITKIVKFTFVFNCNSVEL